MRFCGTYSTRRLHSTVYSPISSSRLVLRGPEMYGIDQVSKMSVNCGFCASHRQTRSYRRLTPTTQCAHRDCTPASSQFRAGGHLDIKVTNLASRLILRVRLRTEAVKIQPCCSSSKRI